MNEPPVTTEYMYNIWSDNDRERIHVSELQDPFGDWIREYFPRTKYIYIDSSQPNIWNVKLRDGRKELYSFKTPISICYNSLS